jgi:hypothetical protein
MPNNDPHADDPFRDPNLPSLADALREFESMPDETPARKLGHAQR